MVPQLLKIMSCIYDVTDGWGNICEQSFTKRGWANVFCQELDYANASNVKVKYWFNNSPKTRVYNMILTKTKIYIK